MWSTRKQYPFKGHMSWYLKSFFWWMQLPSNWRWSGAVFPLSIENNRFYITARLLYYYTIGLQELAQILHPMTGKTKTSRASLAHVFPRFKSATCDYLEFWLVRIVCVLCDLLGWFTLVFAFLPSQYQTVVLNTKTKTKVIASFPPTLNWNCSYTKEVIINRK